MTFVVLFFDLETIFDYNYLLSTVLRVYVKKQRSIYSTCALTSKRLQYRNRCFPNFYVPFNKSFQTSILITQSLKVRLSTIKYDDARRFRAFSNTQNLYRREVKILELLKCQWSTMQIRAACFVLDFISLPQTQASCHCQHKIWRCKYLTNPDLFKSSIVYHCHIRNRYVNWNDS